MVNATQSANSFAVVFPGQGSQSVGMLREAAEADPVVLETFEEASGILEFDLWQACQNGPEEELSRTERTQPVMLAAGVALWRLWLKRGGPLPAFMAGHSLGEYTALVCAGTMAFTDAVAVVNTRARLMQAAVAPGEGAMAAILGLADEEVIRLCAEADWKGVVEAANFNCPGQVVIAGHWDAVEAVMEQARGSGAKRCVRLPVSVPSHCRLMKPASEALRGTLDGVAFHPPACTVIHNVDVTGHADGDSLREALAGQLFQPVKWAATMAYLAGQGVQQVVECGPGKVLAGLAKRCDRSITAHPVYDGTTLEQAITALA